MSKQLKLTDGKREEMFLAYCGQQTIGYVIAKCGVHHLTAKKYRGIDNWDERYAKVRKRTLVKEDDEAVRCKQRHLKLGQALQKIGSSMFFDETGKLKKTVIDAMKAADGIKAIAEGVRIEKETVGDDGAEITIKIKLPKDLEDLE